MMMIVKFPLLIFMCSFASDAFASASLHRLRSGHDNKHKQSAHVSEGDDIPPLGSPKESSKPMGLRGHTIDSMRALRPDPAFPHPHPSKESAVQPSNIVAIDPTQDAETNHAAAITLDFLSYNDEDSPCVTRCKSLKFAPHKKVECILDCSLTSSTTGPTAHATSSTANNGSFENFPKTTENELSMSMQSMTLFEYESDGDGLPSVDSPCVLHCKRLRWGPQKMEECIENCNADSSSATNTVSTVSAHSATMSATSVTTTDTSTTATETSTASMQKTQSEVPDIEWVEYGFPSKNSTIISFQPEESDSPCIARCKRLRWGPQKMAECIENCTSTTAATATFSATTELAAEGDSASSNTKSGESSATTTSTLAPIISSNVDTDCVARCKRLRFGFHHQDECIKNCDTESTEKSNKSSSMTATTALATSPSITTVDDSTTETSTSTKEPDSVCVAHCKRLRFSWHKMEECIKNCDADAVRDFNYVLSVAAATDPATSTPPTATESSTTAADADSPCVAHCKRLRFGWQKKEQCIQNCNGVLVTNLGQGASSKNTSDHTSDASSSNATEPAAEASTTPNNEPAVDAVTTIEPELELEGKEPIEKQDLVSPTPPQASSAPSISISPTVTPTCIERCYLRKFGPQKLEECLEKCQADAFSETGQLVSKTSSGSVTLAPPGIRHLAEIPSSLAATVPSGSALSDFGGSTKLSPFPTLNGAAALATDSVSEDVFLSVPLPPIAILLHPSLLGDIDKDELNTIFSIFLVQHMQTVLPEAYDIQGVESDLAILPVAVEDTILNFETYEYLVSGSALFSESSSTPLVEDIHSVLSFTLDESSFVMLLGLIQDAEDPVLSSTANVTVTVLRSIEIPNNLINHVDQAASEERMSLKFIALISLVALSVVLISMLIVKKLRTRRH